jgi:hypothetical protein
VFDGDEDENKSGMPEGEKEDDEGEEEKKDVEEKEDDDDCNEDAADGSATM